MTSPWQKWKSENKDKIEATASDSKKRTTGANVSPIDLVRRDTDFASVELQESRYAICKACDSLTKTTKQCRECGCFMKLKVKLVDAVCPLGKW